MQKSALYFGVSMIIRERMHFGMALTWNLAVR